MLSANAPRTDRRQFLRMLAASPALPYVALSPTILHALGQEPFREGGPAAELIASPEDALTVFDFEAVAKEKLHYGHVAFLGGTEDEGDVPRQPRGVHAVPAPRPAPGRHQPHRHVGLALRRPRPLPDPPLPLRRAQRLPSARRGRGGPRRQHPRTTS